jgi:enoyl-CoA hydratase/carnithine racemase
MTEETVLYETDGAIALLTLNRPAGGGMDIQAMKDKGT